MNPGEIHKAIFSITSDCEFNDLCIRIFRFQVAGNPVYRQYLNLLSIEPSAFNHYSEIPFLPIGFFKNHRVYCYEKEPEITYASSGTTGSERSLHHVAKTALYEESFLNAFNLFYGIPEQYRIFALLPSYLERNDSSLIYMTDKLIRESRSPESGFYKTGSEELIALLNQTNQKTLLLGVTFALLDLAEATEIRSPGLIVMETGGMKGRRREMVREEVHETLKRRFHVAAIHSEYGMTELLSQAYSKGEGRFRTPPWMKVLMRDTNDPLGLIGHSQTGGINVIDLANLYSCSFVATEDLGRSCPDGTFEVLGRFDSSDIRGCNLLVV